MDRSRTNEFVTDALYRIIQNERELYDGARFSVQVGYIEGYDRAYTQWVGTVAPSFERDHHALARVQAMDDLKQWIEDQLFDDEGDRTGEYVSRTLAHAAFDLVDWHNLSRRILQSVAESTDGYYQMSGPEQEAATLAICRQFVAEQEGENE